MKTKTFEVRDRATFMPALAIKLEAVPGTNDRYLLGRAGFGASPEDFVILHFLEAGGCEYDPYAWMNASRTRQVAHEYIIKHFDTLESGAVVDVEFILGETDHAKISERYEND